MAESFFLNLKEYYIAFEDAAAARKLKKLQKDSTGAYEKELLCILESAMFVNFFVKLFKNEFLAHPHMYCSDYCQI